MFRRKWWVRVATRHPLFRSPDRLQKVVASEPGAIAVAAGFAGNDGGRGAESVSLQNERRLALRGGASRNHEGRFAIAKQIGYRYEARTRAGGELCFRLKHSVSVAEHVCGFRLIAQHEIGLAVSV